MDIRILDRLEAATIDPLSWDSLAQRSCVPNPFYERWHLLSALEHLDLRDQVFVITVYHKGRLVCLFPVCLQRKGFLFRYVILWHFRDCLASDVLREPGIRLAPIVQEVMSRLRVTLLISPAHVKGGFEVGEDFNYCQIRKLRRAVTRLTSWDEYLRGLPRKHRKESKRILSRLIDKEGVRYVTSANELGSEWFSRYCEIEQQSWKATGGRLLSAEDDRIRYYEKAIERGCLEKKVEFQALLKEDEVLAISFRFTSGRKGFDIKTSYNEKYKALYPGVVLELLNIKNVLVGGYDLIDSCGWHNRVVERFWPDRIDVFRTVVFLPTILGKTASLAYRLFKRLRMRCHPTDLTCAWGSGWTSQRAATADRDSDVDR